MATNSQVSSEASQEIGQQNAGSKEVRHSFIAAQQRVATDVAPLPSATRLNPTVRAPPHGLGRPVAMAAFRG